MDGKILEYTDEVKEQKNSAKTDGDQQKTENAGQSGEQQDQKIKKKRAGSSRVPLKKDGKDCEV